MGVKRCGAQTADGVCARVVSLKPCPHHGTAPVRTQAPAPAASVAAAGVADAPDPLLGDGPLTPPSSTSLDDLDVDESMFDAEAEALTGRIDELLPDDFAEYHEATERRHFSLAEGGVGSQFGDPDSPLGGPSNLRELLEEAGVQRGGLDGDDRDALIASGAPRDAFVDGPRYLMVHTPGVQGVVAASDLDDDDVVSFEVTKPDAPPTAIVDDGSVGRPRTDVATVIVGPAPSDPSREVLWTAHPGLPVRPTSSEQVADGTKMTVREVRERLGGDVTLLLRDAPGR